MIFSGTTISIVNLFSKLPVRKQFYQNSKKRKDELKKILDLVTSFAIIMPKLHITLTHDK